MARQENTRQKIIDASFKIISERNYAKFSLNEVAQAVGISKAAIFRHFRNKDELLSEMRNQFLSDFRTIKFSGISDIKDVEPVISDVVDFFMAKPVYLSYFLNTVVCNDKFLNELNSVISNYGYLESIRNFCNESQLPEKKSFYTAYCGITIIYFLKTKLCDEQFSADFDMEHFKKNLASILINGLGHEESCVSPERRKELDELCKCNLEEIPEKQNRFFKGFVEAFKKNGFQDLTVEKLAAEIGISKSSIYSFYESKDDLIREVLEKEIALASMTMLENLTNANNTDEMIYVLLRSVTNYFIARPYIVMLHSWLVFEGKEITKKEFGGHILDFPESIVPENFQFKNSEKDIFITWGSGLSVILMVIGMHRQINDGWNETSVNYVFDFIQCGLKNNKGDAK